MNLAAFFMAISTPIVLRVLMQLGIGIITFVGVEAAVNNVISLAQQNYAGLPATALQFLAIAGVNTALGIIAGGITARLSLMILKRFTLK